MQLTPSAVSSRPTLSVLLTSPRLPAGLLAADAWRAIWAADLVAAGDPAAPLSDAVRAAGVDVRAMPGVGATDLVDAAAAVGHLLWLAADDGDDALRHQLAAEVVRRAEDGAAVDVEVIVGSHDPMGARLLDLVAVMDRLRSDCPWDREQTHASLVRYLTEEAYETIEAIETGDRDHLREELGDLLLQVMFHARIGAEDPSDPFDIDDVAAGIVEKLVRRHPHVFGDVAATDAAAVEQNWESIKAAEKSRESAVDGIPPGLPALTLAAKVVARVAARSDDLSVPVPTDLAYTAESLGEVLFALVAAAQAAGLDPEQALRERTRREMAAVRAAEQRRR